MKLCTKCFDFNCSCEKPKYQQIDDGLVEIISELNKQFIRLDWGIHTKYCCEGHVVSQYLQPHTYIMFGVNSIHSIVEETNHYSFLIEDFKLIRTRNYDSYITFCGSNMTVGINFYCINSLKDIKLFLKKKADFQIFFWEKIEILKNIIIQTSNCEVKNGERSP